jgi:flagellar hook assembly protein FlgD
VTLTVYDVSGRLVTTLVDETRGPGVHEVSWDGRDAARRQVSSGVYFYRIDAGSFVETKRMVLLK